MNMRVLIHSVFILFLFMIGLSLRGQGVHPDMRTVIGSAGDQVKGNSLRVSYTIGEPVVHTSSTSEKIYTQGFHQGPMAIADLFDIEVYNAFSPDGDGINESWIIDRIDYYPENKVLIFNRWGDLLQKYEGYDNDEKVWEGRGQNGKALPAGTYYYVIKAGEGFTKKGYVQITK